MAASPLVTSQNDHVGDRYGLEGEPDTANSPLLPENPSGRSAMDPTGRAANAERRHPEDQPLDPVDIAYGVSSFMAIVKPVTLTMVLAASITVSLYHDTAGAVNRDLAIYEVYDESSTALDTSSVRLGKSLVNAFIIVLVLAGATFVIVMLYWLRCMRCLWGYMAFSSAVLLGLMGGAVWQSALEKFQVPCDVFTFYGILWNFAVVGVMAIFHPKGIPTVVTQAYLVATSVIMAWQLSRFEEWTGWCLLVVLALYDLCAVLTPCGPLKALVNLMQRYNDPMPGLLYEAELPPGTARGRPNPPAGSQREAPDAVERQPLASTELRPLQVQGGGAGVRRARGELVEGASGQAHEAAAASENDSSPSDEIGTGRMMLVEESSNRDERGTEADMGDGGGGRKVGMVGSASEAARLGERVVELSGGQATRRELDEVEALIGGDGEEQGSTEEEVRGMGAARGRGTPEGGAEATVDLSTAQDAEEGVSIKLMGSNGVGKLLVMARGFGRAVGKICDEGADTFWIRKGLGDFVFYSVLVSKAALYGFTAWAVCTVVIIFGLGATLVLLAMYRMALPALPISIGLGTVFYLLTRLAIQPYIEALNETPLYL